MIKQDRILTINKEYSPRAHGKHKTIPGLKLRGIWLGEQGFKPGQKVRVKVRESLLVIEPLKEQGEDKKLQQLYKQLKKLTKKYLL